MKKNSFLILLEQRKKKGVKPKKQRPPKWLFPTNQEKKFDKTLYNLVFELKNLIKEYLIPEIPSMIEEVNSKTPNDRQDSFLDRLNNLIIFIRKRIQNSVDETIFEADKIGLEISRFNKQQSDKLNNTIFGFDLFVDEPWLKDQLQLFSDQNEKLIRGIPDQELERISGDVERGLQQGRRFTDIAKDIQKSYGISHRKAKTIARNQTTQLNASLTRYRQQEVGIEKYQWQTSGDERVRPTHRANDGKIFSWDKPPAITGHPGNDINCRCVALPVLEY